MISQFGNRKIKTEEYNEILAILAVKKCREMEGDTSNMELNFTSKEIAEAVERFYSFEYSYSYGYCAGNDCKKKDL